MRPPDKELPSLDDAAIARNSVYNLLGAVLPAALAVLSVPVTIRLLGLELFALLSLLWAALRLASAPGLGYASSVVRNVAHGLGAGERQLGGVVRACFLMQLAVSLAAAALLWAAAPWLAAEFFRFGGELSGEAVFAFRAAAAILPVYAASELFCAVLAAHQRFGALNAVKLVFEPLFLLLPPGVFLAGGGFRALAWALLAGQLLQAAAALALLRRRGLLRGVLAPSTRGAADLSAYAGWAALNRSAVMGSEESARLVTGAVCGPAALALYNVAHEVYTSLSALPQSFMKALFPAYSAACAREDKARLDAYFYAYAAKLLPLNALAFSGLALFAPEVLLLLTGAEQPARLVLALQLFALAELAAGTNYVAASWFGGRNRPRVPALVQTFSLAAFLPACWLAARAFGVAGTAGAVLFKMLLENALYIAAAERAGAGAGRGLFAGAALAAAALAALALLLGGLLPLSSDYKTAFFLAAMAAAGLAAARARPKFSEGALSPEGA